jgi:transcription elongation GreA/GreB family factor
VRTITTTSPLGQAVNGAKLDDEIEVQAPGGTFHYVVVGLRPRD